MKNAFKALSTIAFASFACLFTACGDTTTNIYSDNGEEIADEEFDDEDEEGDENIVENSAGKKQAKSSSSSKKKSSSSSVADEEKSSSSSSQKDDSKSSSSVKHEQNSSANETPDVVKFKKKSVAGVCQKGPFVTGSTVKLYELDGETYAQTDVNFSGKIASDKGEFEVSGVALASQYALLEANGKYYNEVSGQKSSGAITLKALADLSDREKVNVNLLTHLEYGRALYLVGSGLDMSAAKEQAEAEVLKAFGIQGDFANSEDLNIFGTGEGNAALLALSILLQGDRSEAELVKLLDKIAADIEKDGKWDDEATKAKIADWASLLEMEDKLSTFRSKITGWNLGPVPEFEKYVRNFWRESYGLGDCDAENEGRVTATANELSETYGSLRRYICKSGAWETATDVEKDTYQWEAGEDGEIKVGSVTKVVSYVYDEAQKQWVEANESEEKLNLGCTTNRAGQVEKKGEILYVCENGDWQETTEMGLETNGEECTAAEVGKVISGKETATNKYYCTADGWMSLMGDWDWNVPKEARLNPDIKYGTMTDNRDGKEYKTVKIGNQTWMAENLNFAYDKGTGKSFCYDDNDDNCAVTGRFYTWAAAIDSFALANDEENPMECGDGKTCTLPDVVKGVCPDGWHLPSKAEWDELFETVGGLDVASLKLRSQSGWSEKGDGIDAYGFSGDDAFGFSILPSGGATYPANGALYEAYFYSVGKYSYLWTSTESGKKNAYYVSFLHYAEAVYWDASHKYSSRAVRCVKN